jgi:hypothetical protein
LRSWRLASIGGHASSSPSPEAPTGQDLTNGPADLAHGTRWQAEAPAALDPSGEAQQGEIGVAPFDAKASPYGWHIIRRMQ